MKSKHTYLIVCSKVSLLVIGFLLMISHSQAQRLEEYTNLSGRWKFSVGDNRAWAEPSYNDSHWETIDVPGQWESKGFNGYDGYAWYRTSVKAPKNTLAAGYYLSLGYIDDVDEVFVNGVKIGSTGQFPPHYTTAFRAQRMYLIPHHVLEDAEMMSIAIRVFDEGGEGGIIHGNISIMADYNSARVALDFQGMWKFRTGDCSEIPGQSDYENWDDLLVPGTWEDQGYKNYDGFACYVKEFDLDGQFEGQAMVLLLGRIDDLDKVFLNGVHIGQSGAFRKETVHRRDDTHMQFRNYYIPDSVMRDTGTNVLVVKVYDASGAGGIWQGPVGLISQDQYIQQWRNRRRSGQ